MPITDRIERHGLLLPSFNQKVVERVVVITDDHTSCFGLVVLRLMRFLRVLVNLRVLPLVGDNFLKVMFPLARLIGKLTARKHNSLRGKNAFFIVLLEK